jgi:hypothetical protein
MVQNCFVEHCIETHGWGIFPCLFENCKYEAYSEMCLKHHLRTHKQETDAKILTVRSARANCGKRFKSDFTLQEHYQIHDNILTRCAFCQWGGVKSSEFSIHMNTHFGNKPYACSKCPKRFYATGTRTVHFQAFHDKDEEKYTCDLCDFKTYTNPNLFLHKQKKHPK